MDGFALDSLTLLVPQVHDLLSTRRLARPGRFRDLAQVIVGRLRNRLAKGVNLIDDGSLGLTVPHGGVHCVCACRTV